MLSDYLTLADMSPSAQDGTLRRYSTTQYIVRGYTIEANMTETAKNEFDIGIQIIIDPAVKHNSYPSSFYLYINGILACSVDTVQEASNVAIPTQFYNHMVFEYDISLIQIVPINSDGTENFNEAVFLR